MSPDDLRTLGVVQQMKQVHGHSRLLLFTQLPVAQEEPRRFVWFHMPFEIGTSVQHSPLAGWSAEGANRPVHRCDQNAHRDVVNRMYAPPLRFWMTMILASRGGMAFQSLCPEYATRPAPSGYPAGGIQMFKNVVASQGMRQNRMASDQVRVLVNEVSRRSAGCEVAFAVLARMEWTWHAFQSARTEAGLGAQPSRFDAALMRPRGTS